MQDLWSNRSRRAFCCRSLLPSVASICPRCLGILWPRLESFVIRDGANTRQVQKNVKFRDRAQFWNYLAAPLGTQLRR